MMSLFNFIK